MSDPAEVENLLRRLKQETFVRAIEWHEEVPSTNDRGMALARDAAVALPCLVITGRQTAGRGRGGNRWWSSPGALTFSLLLRLDRNRLPLARWPELSLTAGVAVCEALRSFAPSADVLLKWPNDVYINGRKVCGVLIEIPSTASGAVVVGIGINVNNSVQLAPNEVQSRATAMCDVLSTPVPFADVLIAVLQAIAVHIDLLCESAEKVRSLWRNYDLLRGRQVIVRQQDACVAGDCAGIADDGALLLQTESGIQHVYTGVVEFFL
jgi:BirA family biotin operon repressor/biotin-[acetyl-CoA-carboxylase] ligase